MMGMQGYAEGFLAFYVLVLVVLVVLVAIVRSLCIIFSEKISRAQRARMLIRISAKRVVIFVLLGSVAKYSFDASLRARAYECRKVPSDHGKYIAELCLLQWVPGGNSDYIGRVYDANNRELLVERTFSTPVPEVSWWEDEDVSFERGGDGSALVTLPPSLYDRLLAKLP